MKRHVPFALALAVAIVGGCSAQDPSSPGDSEPACRESFAGAAAYPVFASSEVVTGRNRFLVGLLDRHDAPTGSPAVDLEVAFSDLGRSGATLEPKEMRFVWIDRPYRGLYESTVRFPTAGEWCAHFTIRGEGLDESLKGSFRVAESSETPALGSRPPASDTPTSADVEDLSAISTDPHPNPRFYRYSIADALRLGRPFVVVFSTPKFCTSQVCGPTLKVVKGVARTHRGVIFIHVEPYHLPVGDSGFKPVPAALEWGLPSEPWVFVVDGSGRVAAKFEGIVAPPELRAALARL
jgi:hypothetical protein